MGDVAGHGVTAAAEAGQLRHSLRVYAHEGFSVAESVTRLNELVTNSEFTTLGPMCVVEADMEPPGMRFACAGHPPPLRIPAVGPARLAEVSTGIVLGILGA